VNAGAGLRWGVGACMYTWHLPRTRVLRMRAQARYAAATFIARAARARTSHQRFVTGIYSAL